MPSVVGQDGLEGSPSLQSICDLFRSIINDTFNSGSGEIATDDAPFMKPFLNSAIRDLYSDLRIVGDMRVVKDNFIIGGIPPIPASNPAIQVALTYQGYYNGTSWDSHYLLPPDLMWINKVWQWPSNTAAVFYPMCIAPAGLSGVYQGHGMGQYEMRGNNELWFNGAMLETDIRLRYTAVFPDLIGDEIDFDTTYVPIQDCTNAVAFKMVAYYAQRLSPDQFQLAESQATKFTKKMISESVLNSQTKQFAREPFGNTAQINLTYASDLTYHGGVIRSFTWLHLRLPLQIALPDTIRHQTLLHPFWPSRAFGQLYHLTGIPINFTHRYPELIWCGGNPFLRPIPEPMARGRVFRSMPSSLPWLDTPCSTTPPISQSASGAGQLRLLLEPSRLL